MNYIEPIRRAHLPLWAVGVAIMFGLTAWGGIALTSGFGRIASIWFSNGILVAMLLIYGRTLEISLAFISAGFVANVVLNALVGDPPVMVVGIAVANTVEVSIAVFALRGKLSTSADLLHAGVVLRFFAVALIVAPAAAAVIAAASIHTANDTPVLDVVRLWIPADALGMAIMVPLVLALRPRELQAEIGGQPWARLVALLAPLLIVAIAIFSQSGYPLLFLLFPPLLLVAFRLGFTGAALAISVIAAVAIAATLQGSGPFTLVADASVYARVFTMQLFLGTLIVTMYPVCAMLARLRKLIDDSKQHVIDLSASQATVNALNERMTLAAKAANVGFYSWDLKTNTIEWDAEVHRMLDIEPASGPPTYDAWRSRVHPLDLARSEQTLFTSLSEGKELDMDFRVVWTNGTTRDIRCRGIIQRDAEGAAAKLIGLIIDITELRRIERMKSDFVSVVSHELRTPLTSIRGSIGLLASGRASPANAQQLLDLANRNAERLAILVDDILDMERIETGKMRFNMQLHPLAGLLKQAVEANQAYATRHQVEIKLEEVDESVYVQVDAHRLLQVMANLLSNAAKFSSAGGTIEVFTVVQDQQVRVAVRDHGPGIPRESQNKIFQKFSQVDSSDARVVGGSGLGLAISKAFVESMNGHISFTSERHVGTTFHVDLPRAAP